MELIWQKIQTSPAALWKDWRTMIPKAQVVTVTTVAMERGLHAVEQIRGLLDQVNRAVTHLVGCKRLGNFKSESIFF